MTDNNIPTSSNKKKNEKILPRQEVQDHSSFTIVQEVVLLSLSFGNNRYIKSLYNEFLQFTPLQSLN